MRYGFTLLAAASAISLFLHYGWYADSVRASSQTSSNQVNNVTKTKQKDESAELYHSANLVFGTPREVKDSLKWIRARGQLDMVPHVITAMRFSPMPRKFFVSSLQDLIGHQVKSWFDWMLWLQRNPNVVPHESYVEFKSRVFNSIDPQFLRFFRPGVSFDIRPEEIVWGGVKVDGIPALDNPRFVDIKGAKYLKGGDEVFGLEINGDARAYPLRIMGWHEMFNDIIGGVPISLAYCTLCSAGIAFEGDYKGRKAFDVDQPFTFGSSGFLYQSNKLMYDRNTDSLWNQFTGKPVSGPLLGSGIELKIRPVVITSWKKWKAAHPDTKVLDINTGYRRNYGSGVVYQDYFASPELMFPAAGDDLQRLREKDQIFGMRLEGGTKAWPLSAFKKGRVLNDVVGQVLF